MCRPRRRSSVVKTHGDRADFKTEEITEEPCGVRARRAFLVDSAIGLVLAVTSWMASYYVWVVDPEVLSAPHGSCEMGLTTSLKRLAQGRISLHHCGVVKPAGGLDRAAAHAG